MVGREVLFHLDKKPVEAGRGGAGHRATCMPRTIRACLPCAGISLNVRAGEIVGLAGVAGNGQSELSQVISGLRKCEKGQVLLNGEPGQQSQYAVRHPARHGLRARRPHACGHSAQPEHHGQRDHEEVSPAADLAREGCSTWWPQRNSPPSSRRPTTSSRPTSRRRYACSRAGTCSA